MIYVSRCAVLRYNQGTDTWLLADWSGGQWQYIDMIKGSILQQGPSQMDVIIYAAAFGKRDRFRHSNTSHQLVRCIRRARACRVERTKSASPREGERLPHVRVWIVQFCMIFLGLLCRGCHQDDEASGARGVRCGWPVRCRRIQHVVADERDDNGGVDGEVQIPQEESGHVGDLMLMLDWELASAVQRVVSSRQIIGQVRHDGMRRKRLLSVKTGLKVMGRKRELCENDLDPLK